MGYDIVDAVLALNGIESVDQNNTWETVRKHRAKLLNSEDYPVLNGLETSWQLLESSYNDDMDVIKRESDEGTASTPLEAFLHYIDSGFYPPPELMLAIYDCFTIYGMCGGKMELEDVFFGSRPKGQGNYAKRKSKGALYRHFHFQVGLERMKEKNQGLPVKPLPQIAEEYWESDFLGESKGEAPDIDTFLRGYRRWKEAGQIF